MVSYAYVGATVNPFNLLDYPVINL